MAARADNVKIAVRSGGLALGARSSEDVSAPCAPAGSGRRVFLLSPANASGARGAMLLNPNGQGRLTRQLRETRAPIAEVFSFMSSLYFRGKLEYARKFANAPAGLPAVWIITPASGLLTPEHAISRAELTEMTLNRVDHRNPVYRDSLDRDARRLKKRLEPDVAVIFLGSIATRRYLDPLEGVFGTQLMVPIVFRNLGNMSRGSLLFQCLRQETELEYVAAIGSASD